MNKKQPEALRLADELCEAIAEYPEPTALEAQAAAELRRQHARITELESQLAQRFDAADVATAAQPAAPARDLAAVIKGAADKLDAAVCCHPNAVDTLIHEALEILDGDREPDATHTSRGQAPAQPDPAYSEACDLATALFKKHFAHLPDYASGRVVWGLCDSTAGVISQIDNMVSRLVQPPTTSPQAAESVPAPVPPPECETEAEKRAFAFGWFKALESERMKAESVQEDACHAPPLGWRCTRKAGHEGPCAAVEYEGDKQFVERGMQRIRDAEDAARYRWLRRWKGQEHEPPFTVQHEIDGTLWGGDLDAAIDAAMDKGGA